VLVPKGFNVVRGLTELGITQNSEGATPWMPRPDQDHKWWAGKRLAHIFEGGWHIATFRRKTKAAESDVPLLVFYYKDVSEETTHQLHPGEYGANKKWVIIEPQVAKGGKGASDPYKKAFLSHRKR
jgi:hypothetical protein